MWAPPEPRVFESRAARRRALLSVGGVLTAMGVAALLLQRVAPWLLDPVALRAHVVSFGVWAPVVFVATQVVQVVLAPIPGQLFAMAGGYLFGPLRGTLYSMVGVTVGSYLVILGARTFGRPAVERWIDDAVLARFEDTVQETGVPVLFLLYLLPTFPDDALCAIAGLTTIRIRTLVALVVVGRAPSFLLVNYAGSSVAEQRFLEAGGILAAIGLLSVLVYVRRDRVQALLPRSWIEPDAGSDRNRS